MAPKGGWLIQLRKHRAPRPWVMSNAIPMALALANQSPCAWPLPRLWSWSMTTANGRGQTSIQIHAFRRPHAPGRDKLLYPWPWPLPIAMGMVWPCPCPCAYGHSHGHTRCHGDGSSPCPYMSGHGLGNGHWLIASGHGHRQEHVPSAVTMATAMAIAMHIAQARLWPWATATA